jgi:glucosylceramidase
MITVDPANGTIRFNPEFYVMKHFAGFVRPGATVQRLEGPWNAMAVGFRYPNNDRDVVVVGNPFKESQTLILRRGPERFCADLPARSVNTFVL